MKILFFSHDSRLFGATRSLIDLLLQLKKKEVSCFVILPREGPLCKILSENAIPFEIISFSWWVTATPISFLKHPVAYLKWKKSLLGEFSTTLNKMSQLKALCQKWDCDIIYSNSSVIYIGFLLAKLSGKPHVWHIREFKDIDHHLFPSWGNFLFTLAIKKSSLILFISQSLRKYIVGNWPSKKVKVVANGVGSVEDFIHYKEGNALDDAAASFTFLILGTIHEKKGQKEAIKALSAVREEFENVRLLVAGGGDSQTLKDFADGLNIISHVEFLGPVDTPHEVYGKAHVLLMCSKNEAFGRVTAEAMMHSLPVIGYNNAGTAEIITHKTNGLLYNNEEELIKYMKLLIEDRNLAKKMGANGWATAKAKYNSEIYADSIYNALKDLIS